MGTCIICGASTDGVTCRSHEEDVAFDFRGTSPQQLVTNRYYRGTVDGFADFGVFVNIGDRVTGLLHRSEVDGRLESLDWEAGDEVFVQVTGVHDNGNVDLGWSIRQSEREFRGRAIHDPTADEPEVVVDELEAAADDEAADETADATEDETADAGFEFGGEEESDDEDDDGGDVTEAEVDDATDDAEAEPPSAESEPEATEEPDRAPVEALSDRVGDRVRLEGEVVAVRQTGGPTVFALADETGRVDCAAFVGAGERAYPEVEVDDVVTLVGEVERRRGDLQVETESLEVLTGDARAAVAERLDAALEDEAAPPETEPLVETAALADAPLVEAATAIRRAVIESRPVVVRHTATVDGYVAGAAIERAVLPLVRERHAESDAEYHYVDRRPLDGEFYEMDDATKDVTRLLEDAERHGENHPLVVLADTGRTEESGDALDLLATYDVPRVVVDAGEADAAAAADVFCTVDDASTTSAALAANVAALVNPDVRDELGHLPAVSYWAATPEVYAEAATDAGYGTEAVADSRAALALLAHYQTYEDKREIVRDLLWPAADSGFAAHVASQFRARLDEELATVESHVEHRDVEGVTLAVVDLAAFTHRYEFPPGALLLDALAREDDAPDAVVGVDEDELHLRAAVDVRSVGAAVAEALPEAGVRPRGARDGHVEFLVGERDAVRRETVAEVAARLASEDVEATVRD